MARNVTVYDLDNYPDNGKTVTLDHLTLVPTGYEGDEQWVLSFSTTAYSDNTNRTAIQDIYVQEIKAGWAKSSGLAGNRFTISSSNKTLGIKMDGGSTWYYIQLDEGTNVSADVIAADMEEKIREIPNSYLWNSSDDQLAYINASVEYINGKFYIISGTVSPYYTGSNRSAASVTYSGTDTCYEELGFKLGTDSFSIAGTAIKEALITSNYTADTDTVNIGTGTGVAVGDCLAITDGTNTDYFTAISGTTDSAIKVATMATHNYIGISHNYVTTSGGSKVQVLRMQDPDQVPVAYYDNIDSISRWGVKSIANQVDYSS